MRIMEVVFEPFSVEELSELRILQGEILSDNICYVDTHRRAVIETMDDLMEMVGDETVTFLANEDAYWNYVDSYIYKDA